jgi:hypothetical protein
VNVEKHSYLQAIVTAECFVGIMRSCYSDSASYDIIEDAGFITNGRLFINLLKSEYLPSRKESYLWNDENGFIVALIHIARSLKGEESKDFFAILKRHVLTGDLYPAQYAVLYDSANSADYGMSAIFDEISGKIVLAQPEDVKNVDKRRAEIFLPPLWVWAKKTGYQLPKNYEP